MTKCPTLDERALTALRNINNGVVDTDEVGNLIRDLLRALRLKREAEIDERAVRRR